MAYINWDSVYSYFIANQSTTLANTAKHFGIHVDYVRAKAAEGKWTARKLEVHQKAVQIMENKTANRIAQRNEAMAQMGRALQGLGMEAIAQEKMKPRNFEEARKSIETGIKIERAALNMDKNPVPSVEIANNQGQRIKIMWGDDEPVADYIKSGNNWQLTKAYDGY